jgi:tetratricopeptide (TPR) repeat protein
VISYNNIGLLYLQTGFLKEALSSFDLALEMRLNFHSLIGRGVTLTLLARFQDAISCFEEISAEGEEKKILLTNQGHAYYEAGLIDSACSCFQRGAKLFPGEPHFYNGMAMLAFELGTMT